MPSETEPAPSETFEILGHETRLAIVEELAKHRRTQWQPSGLGFAELRKAVGIADAGKFNYHLGELRGHFVYKDDDEYVLRNAGLELAGAIVAGTYTERADTRRAAVDRACPACGSSLEGVYERGYLRIECPDHGAVFENSVPPGAAAGRSMDELVAVANRDAKHTLEHARDGTCPHCWGSMSITVPADPSSVLEGRGDDAEVEQVLVQFSCERCEMTFWFPVSVCVVDHPAVVSLYGDHGIDVRDRGYLELDFVTGSGGAVVSTDPVRVAVDVAVADDALRLTLDGSLTVVDVERSSVDA
ncbi:winged helix-turn-helix domain-containing protein [Halococcus agarilyticus]|uniref:winged helix-turn-helix domain-containing protein n=1 Tax=Halococcus agarilyticus TaxID=1232219 RepID=UPI0006782B46|nr:winged helix-turn-helix domain-containing protein [Halococcus agarilyticus]